MICFQKVEEDNTNFRPPKSYNKLLLMQLWLWEVFEEVIMINGLTRLFMIIIKDPLFVTSYNLVKKEIIKVNKALSRLQISLVFNTHEWSIYQLLFFYCSVTEAKLLQHWTKCPKNFSNTLTKILLKNCLQVFVIKTAYSSFTFFIFKAVIFITKVLEPPSYCSITCGSLSPCSVDIDRSFKDIVPNFELVQHKKAKIVFLHIHH